MRISGINLPDNKRIDIALTALHGVGRSRAAKILREASIDAGLKASALSSDQEEAIRKIVDGFTLEGELKRNKAGNIKRLIDTQTHRGMRHSRRLPVRGQTTKTNSRTVRGNKRTTMGSGRVKATKT